MKKHPECLEQGVDAKLHKCALAAQESPKTAVGYLMARDIEVVEVAGESMSVYAAVVDYHSVADALGPALLQQHPAVSVSEELVAQSSGYHNTNHICT